MTRTAVTRTAVTRTGVTIWPAIAAARAAQVDARLPFWIVDQGQVLRAGSVARRHLSALGRWQQALQIDGAGVTLTLPAAERSAFLAEANAMLREQGLILAWRDETYPLLAEDGGVLLATVERAASRFWGHADLWRALQRLCRRRRRPAAGAVDCPPQLQQVHRPGPARQPDRRRRAVWSRPANPS